MPVVNPIWFYLMSVCGGLALLLGVMGFLAVTVGGIGCLVYHSEDDVRSIKAFKIFKRLVISGLVALGVNIFIPSQTTIEKMLIAQNVTYERVEQAADTVTDVYNDIMDLFRESKNVDQ